MIFREELGLGIKAVKWGQGSLASLGKWLFINLLGAFQYLIVHLDAQVHVSQILAQPFIFYHHISKT